MRGLVDVAWPDTDADVAVERLLDLEIGCLSVVDDRWRVVGSVTRTDFLRLATDLLGRAPPEAP